MSTKKPAFRLVIEKNNIDEAKLSRPIKGYIQDYVDIENGIAELEAVKEKNDGKLSEPDQRELDDYYEGLAEKDKDLVARINTWIANAERNKEAGKRLAEGKKLKNQQKGPGGENNPPTPPAPAPPAPVKKNENGGAPPDYTPVEEIVEEEPKKETGVLGWLIGGAVVIIGVLIGVNLKNRQ